MRWREIVEGVLDMANAAKKATTKPLTERYDPAFVQKIKEAAEAKPVASFTNAADAKAYVDGLVEQASRSAKAE